MYTCLVSKVLTDPSVFEYVDSSLFPGLSDLLELEDISGIGWGIIAICIVVHISLVELAKLGLRSLNRHGGLRNWVRNRGRPQHYEMQV